MTDSCVSPGAQPEMSVRRQDRFDGRPGRHHAPPPSKPWHRSRRQDGAQAENEDMVPGHPLPPDRISLIRCRRRSPRQGARRRPPI